MLIVLIGVIGRPCNVKMHPRCPKGKFTEEHAGRDGTCTTTYTVDDVSSFAFDFLAIVLVDREAPDAILGLRSGTFQTLPESFIVRQDTGGVRTESHDNGAGEGCNIDDVIGLFGLRSIGDGVC